MAIVVTSNFEHKPAAPAEKPAAVVSEEVKKSAAPTEETHEEQEKLEASDASIDSTDGKDADSDESDKEGEDRAQKVDGVQKKINKLTKQKHDERREKEYWKAEALRLQAKPGEQKVEKKVAATPTADGRPKSDDFETHEAYVEAIADWKYEQRKNADAQKERETNAKSHFQQSVESLQTKVKEFQKVQKDFEEVLEEVADIPMSMGVQESLLGSDFGPQVMYELAKDRENYERINALSPLAAARELGRIEARIAEKMPSKEEPVKNSKAPAPMKPVGGNVSAGGKKSIFDSNISQSEYEKLRREQMKGRSAWG